MKASAAVLAILLAVPLAPLAAAQSHHRDYGEAKATDDPLLAAGDAWLGAGEHATRLAAGSRQADAERQQQFLAEMARMLESAQLVAADDVDRPALLGPLANATAASGRALADVLAGAFLAFDANQSAERRALGLAIVEQTLQPALDSLDAWAPLGLDTGPLRQALLDLWSLAQRLRLPAFGDFGLDLTLEPTTARFQQPVRALLRGAPGAAYTLDAVGLRFAGNLSGAGTAVVAFRVPWDATTGPNPVAASAGSQQADATLNVTQVPTRLVGVRLDPPGDGRSVRGALRDDDARAMVPSQVAWDATLLSTGERLQGTTNTTATGLFAFPAPALRGNVAYAGNRTHLGATGTWGFTGINGTGASSEADELAEAIEGIERAFRRANDGRDPAVLSEPATPWVWVALVALAVLAALGFELEDVGSRLQPRRRARSLLAPGAGGPAARRDEHPLLAFVRSRGEDPAPMTMRDLRAVLGSEGAPDATAWLREHEAAYYTSARPVPAPTGLLAWLRRRLR